MSSKSSKQKYTTIEARLKVCEGYKKMEVKRDL